MFRQAPHLRCKEGILKQQLNLCFRWYGINDRVSLRQITQIPQMRGIVSALYDIPSGEVWDRSRLQNLKRTIENAGLEFSVIESIPVHEDIKIGSSGRDQFIEAWCESVRNVGAVGIPIVTYNFMPIFDWMRTDLEFTLTDGSTCLSYIDAALEKVDLSQGTGELPGWGAAYSAEQLNRLIRRYRDVDEDALWRNLEYFLKAVAPVAEEAGVKLAIHPDDPPWSIFGLPRIMTNEAALRRVCDMVPSPANGIALCAGSLGSDPSNDIVSMVKNLGDKVHYVHARNVKITGHRCFYETYHSDPEGNVPLPAFIRALYEIGFEGPIRPDHGRMIWGESGRAGYGLYDRALGAMYLVGLWASQEKRRRNSKQSSTNNGS